MHTRLLVSIAAVAVVAFGETTNLLEQNAPSSPAELVVTPPPGWTQKVDAATRVTFIIPPEAETTKTSSSAELVVFPAVDYSGSADDWHAEMMNRILRGGRLLEPVVRNTVSKVMRISAAHFITAQGTNVRVVLYTARWGTRAQAFAFSATTDAALMKEGLVADRAIGKIVIPTATGAGSVAPPPRAAATADQSAGSSAATSADTSLSSAAADPGDTMPVLEYNDPPNFWRGGAGGKSYAEYQGSEVNFVLCVYPFRELTGDIKTTFEQTLLSDQIDVMYRQEGVAGRPQFTLNRVTGADLVVEARFQDGVQKIHQRTVIIAGGRWAAIVDMIAPTAYAWQKAYPSVLQTLQSMHVGRQPAPPLLSQGPGADGARLAGLFQGMKNKFTVNLMLGPGYGSPKLALHYLLFAADGRVYRCYDFPPNGSEAASRTFDFASAERQDPQNTGRFVVRGNQLYIKWGGPNRDEILTTVSDPNALVIDTVSYVRKY